MMTMRAIALTEAAGPTLDPINNLLLEVWERGWHVYTAQQCELPRPDHWQISLRQIVAGPVAAIAYGQGRTFLDALLMAIDGMDSAATRNKPAYIVHHSQDKPALIDLRHLLGGVGPTLSRRP